VISVLGGLGAAFAFATTTLCYARASRLIDTYSVLSWVMLVGLLIVIPLVAVAGLPKGLDRGSAGWLVLAGTGNVAGLLLTYRALKTGKVSIVAPITCTEGAIAAVISIAAGEQLGGAAGAMLGVIAGGILLASLGPATHADTGARSTLVTIVLATAAACAFGASLYAIGRAGRELPIAWALLPARLVGVSLVAFPLGLAGRVRLTRDAAPYVFVGGVCEVLGLASFTIGARHGLAVSAVLASQFGAIAAVVGLVSFRERLSGLQIGGVCAIAIGVAVLSALQA
jgi:uncharacterized membrane protein